MQRQYTVQVSSVQEMVYRTLRDKIVSMELKPGTTISTQEIADSMSVSRTPVREAFIRLATESLVEIMPQRKTLVSRIDVSRAQQDPETMKLPDIRLSPARFFISSASPVMSASFA